MEKIEEVEKDMTPKLIGEVYLKLNIKSNQYIQHGLYECPYCTKKFECVSTRIKYKGTKSCGCLRKIPKFKHGLNSNKFYKTWGSLLYRCNNPKHEHYPEYGGRGIKVCEEWLDVATFVAWAEATHPNIEGMSLDRIDVDGNYEPSNCRWADRVTQAINKRMMKNNKSGFVGIIWDYKNKNWRASIRFNYKLVNLGSFKDKMKAVQARDNYIIENNLPHKLSTQY